MGTDVFKAWRSSVAFFAALALHVGLGAFVRHALGAVSIAPQAYPPSPNVLSEFEIDFDRAEAEAEKPVAVRAADRPAQRGLPLESPVAQRGASRALASYVPLPSDPAAKVQDGDALDNASAHDVDAAAHHAPSERERPIDLGIAAGDWSRWTKPATEARAALSGGEGRRTAPASSTGGLAEELDAKDRERGLGPAGAILSAAHEAARAPTAPARGTAAFSVTVDRNGETEVELLRASADLSAWRTVAEALAATIKRKPPRVKDGAAGIRTVIEISAEERLPNGSLARTEDAKVAVSGPPVRSAAETFQDTRERNPFVDPPPGSAVDKLQFQMNWDQLGAWVKGRGKVCSYQGGVTAQGQPKATGSCDFANIGARPVRVVHAKVINQTSF
jgi:hypothetical protein